MCAVLLWTSTDFLGYAMLFDWSIKGLMVYPYYQDEIASTSLRTYGSLFLFFCFIYVGYRIILLIDYRFRCMKGPFNARDEHKKLVDPP